MNRRQYSHVAFVLLLAVFARLLLFNHVGVWGDAGFYTYDAMLINEGDVPYVDFIGRSPLFNYAYAWTATVFGNSMGVLRAFIVTWWLVAAVPVYALGRWIHSHRAGLVAVVLFTLSPFMLSYGFWANTQSVAAVLAVTAIAVLVYRRTWRTYALAGVLIGAAFLSRRSVITILGAVGLHTLWRMYRDRDLRYGFGQNVALVGGFAGSLAVGYLALAGGDIDLGLKFAETHGWGLISSSGRGGFPLISENAPAEPLNRIDSGRVPIFNDVCQLCGRHTAKTFVKTVIAALVLVGPLLYYTRDWIGRWFTDTLKEYGAAMFGAVALYAVYIAVTNVYLVRAGAVVALVGFGIVAFSSAPISRDVLYDRRMQLLLFILGGLAAGYLYRNRLIHTYYFADFLPYLAAVSGVLYVEMWGATGDE